MEELEVWLDQQKISYTIEKNIVNIKEFGKLLFIKEKEGKIITQEFLFDLSEKESDIIEKDEEIGFFVFKWGSRFYYCKKKEHEKMDQYGRKAFEPDFKLLTSVGDFESKTGIDFCNLAVHTGYELLNGSGECSTWANRAKFLKQKSIGIIDRNTLAGTLPMQLACNKAGIKSILGMTIEVAYNFDENLEHQEKFDLVLLVKNEIGWANLLRISRAINVDYDKFVPEDIVLKNSEGLICIFSKDSIFNFNIFKTDKAKKILKTYKKAFGKSNLFYQLDFTEYSDDEYDMKNLEIQSAYFKNFYPKIKPVLAPDSFYPEKINSEIKDILNTISRKTQPRSKDQYLKDIDTIFEQSLNFFENNYQDIFLESIQNTILISDSCNFKIETGEHKLPKFEVDDPIQFYYDRLAEGFQRKILSKYGDDDEKIRLYMERLDTENDVIVNAGFVDYFLILWDVIRFCKEVDILVGPGRGSAGGSLVAYLLDIIEIDPIEYDLLFERFLNKTRVTGENAKRADSLPDIDSDFEGLRRQEVKRYLETKYGTSSVCSIGAYGRLKVKSALKDFVKIKGVTFVEANYVSKMIEDRANEELEWKDIFMYASKKPILKNFIQKHSDTVEILTAALMQPKSSTVHASAVLILPKFDKNGKPMTIFDWLPVKKIDGHLVSEWEGKYVGEAGFLKEDILGIAQLDKFKKIIQLVEKNTGERINFADIPLNKKSVMSYFKKGLNEDVFQFGTSKIKSYSKIVKPDDVEDLISMNALYRPGPMKFNAHLDFAKIKHGEKDAVFDIGMKEVTNKTLGLYIYQEQVMKAMVVGGLTLPESDEVRTHMKKFNKVALAAFEEKFVAGMTIVIQKKKPKMKKPEEEAKKIWDKLNAFSAYGFNKSHSTAYALMAYWCQYFKAKYPLEFWTASLNFADEKTEIPGRLAEIQSLGGEIEVLQPDINKSMIDFTSYVDENVIYWSLSKIKKAGAVAVEKILECRNLGGEFADLEDFLKRVPKAKVNKGVVTNLILAGAFDSIGGDYGLPIKKVTDRYDILEKYYQSIKTVIPEDIENSIHKTKSWFWILKQKQITGFGMINYKSLIKKSVKNKQFVKQFVAPEDFEDFTSENQYGTLATIAGIITFIKEKNARNGKMADLTIESNNNLLTFTCWPDFYENMSTKLDKFKEKGIMIAISGNLKLDTYKNKNIMFSARETKIYEI